MDCAIPPIALAVTPPSCYRERVKVTGYVGKAVSPNITGTFLSGSNGSNDWDSGAFLETRETTYISRNGPNQNHSKCSFKADRVTSIYGAATTVQSPALQTLIIIRIWSASGWIDDERPYALLNSLASNPIYELKTFPEACPLRASTDCFVTENAPEGTPLLTLTYLAISPVMLG